MTEKKKEKEKSFLLLVFWILLKSLKTHFGFMEVALLCVLVWVGRKDYSKPKRLLKLFIDLQHFLL